MDQEAAVSAEGAGLEGLREILSDIEDDDLRRRALESLQEVEGQLRALRLQAAGAVDSIRDRNGEKVSTNRTFSQVSYKAFVDNVTDTMVVHARDGVAVDVNRAACEKLGYSREEFIGRPPALYDPNAKPSLMGPLTKRLDAGETVTFESTHRRKDGSEYPVEIRLKPFWVGEERFAVSIGLDISDRKEAEERLRESQQRLRLALGAQGMGVWEWKLGTRELYLSPECLPILGLETFSGSLEDLKALVHPEDVEDLRFVAEEGIEGREELAPDFRILRPEGEIRWMRVRSQLDRDEEGRLSRWVGTIRDITEEKIAKETMQQILQVTAPATGEDFFRALTTHLSRVCEVDYAVIAEIEAGGPRIARTKAVAHCGEPADGFTYELDNTPCERALEGDLCHYPTRVRQEFPEDPVLADLGIDSYMGAPLFSAEGELLGILALLGSRPLPRPEIAAALLRVVATRAASELARDRAQTALKASETRYRVFVDQATDGFFQHDVDGLIVDVNRQACRSLGYTREELLGKYPTYFDPQISEEVLQEFNRQLDSGEVISFETVHQRKDGVCFPVEIRVRPAWIDGQRHSFATARDITERKVAEKALLRQKRVLERIAAGAPLPVVLEEVVSLVEGQIEGALSSILLVDGSGEHLQVGAGKRLPESYAEALEGLPIGPDVGCCGTAAYRREPVIAEDIASDPRWDALRELALGSDLKSCWSVPIFGGGGSESGTANARLLGTFGVYHREPARPSEEHLLAVSDAANLAGIAIERTRAERAVRESEARFRTLLENLDNIAVQVFQPDGTITFWNRGSERFYGVPKEEALGRRRLEVMTPDKSQEDVRRMLEEVLRTGISPDSEEEEVVCLDGSKVTVLANWSVHPRPGLPPELFCFDVDITSRKKAEEELSLRQTELLHADRLTTVGQMVAALCHEVAQPLAAIGNYAAASGALLDVDPEENMASVLKYLQGIESENQRCGAILQRLRDFLRHTLPRKSECDLSVVLLDSLSLMGSDLRRHGVTVECDFADDDMTLMVDRVQIQQVVVNLLTNARGAMEEIDPAERILTVRSYVKDGEAVAEVEDRGHGLLPEVRDRLFEPFVTTKEEGMGIGLSISRTIVESHGGHIEAEPGETRGALFRVSIPLWAGEDDG